MLFGREKVPATKFSKSGFCFDPATLDADRVAGGWLTVRRRCEPCRGLTAMCPGSSAGLSIARLLPSLVQAQQAELDCP